MGNILRVLLRLITLVLAISAVLFVLVGGFWYVYQQAQGNSPRIRFSITGSTVERAVLGAYLSLHRAEVSRPARPDDHREVTFSIAPGRSLLEVSQDLVELGLITDAELFRRVVQYMRADQDIQAGVFPKLRRSMTMEEIARELRHGREPGVEVTIPEGWRVEQIAAELQARGVVTASDFLLAVAAGRDDPIFGGGRPPGSATGLEGYLFPDTYQFADPRQAPDGVTPQRALDVLLNNWDRRVTPELRGEAAVQGLSMYEVLTLASIVEREARGDQGKIAGVLLNRLKAGMRLEVDATVQYAKESDAAVQRVNAQDCERARRMDRDCIPWWKPVLLRDLQEVKSPYNTYLNGGLPPGPICNPGLASIRAVLRPEPSEYLYYYSPDGESHLFAKTFEEHVQNIAAHPRK